MNFELPEELKMMQQHVREFARQEIASIAAELDKLPE